MKAFYKIDWVLDYRMLYLNLKIENKMWYFAVLSDLLVLLADFKAITMFCWGIDSRIYLFQHMILWRRQTAISPRRQLWSPRTGGHAPVRRICNHKIKSACSQEKRALEKRELIPVYFNNLCNRSPNMQTLDSVRPEEHCDCSNGKQGPVSGRRRRQR